MQKIILVRDNKIVGVYVGGARPWANPTEPPHIFDDIFDARRHLIGLRNMDPMNAERMFLEEVCDG